MLRMLVPDPVCYEDMPTVLEGTTNIYQPAIHQQLRSWLDILASDADRGLPTGVRGQNHLSSHHGPDWITPAPQFFSRPPAFGKSPFGTASPPTSTARSFH